MKINLFSIFNPIKIDSFFDLLKRAGKGIVIYRL
jgi:hypothetical protein